MEYLYLLTMCVNRHKLYWEHLFYNWPHLVLKNKTYNNTNPNYNYGLRVHGFQIACWGVFSEALSFVAVV